MSSETKAAPELTRLSLTVFLLSNMIKGNYLYRRAEKLRHVKSADTAVLLIRSLGRRIRGMMHLIARAEDDEGSNIRPIIPILLTLAPYGRAMHNISKNPHISDKVDEIRDRLRETYEYKFVELAERNLKTLNIAIPVKLSAGEKSD